MTIRLSSTRNAEDDLLSALVQARDEDDRLTEDELIDLATQMLLAGHETTVSLIGTGVVLLLCHPEQLAALRADPSLVPSAVEEIMRYDGPADTTLLRVALEDVPIGDTTIRKGEAVMAMTGAANFDDEVFAQPGTFDITRTHNPHLGSDTASTSAWAPPWPAWRARSPCTR